MKQMKKKVLLSSILTIAICFGLIAGSTFALFTSDAKVNIVATSGEVEVSATIPESSIQKGSTLGEMLNETSINFKSDENVITLTNIVPGDFVSFDIVITNHSNVAINYRTVIEMVSDAGLWSGLEVSIGGEIYDGNQAKTSAWAQLAPGSEDVVVPVTILFPHTKGNEYESTSCEISYRVEAVQGNTTYVNSASDLAGALSGAAEGATIALVEGVDYGTIDMTGTYKDVTIAGAANTNAFFNVKAGAVLDNVTFEGIVVENYNGVSGLEGAVNIAKGADVDITFKNCTFAPNSGYYGVRVQESTAELRFENCAFNGGKYAAYSSGAPIAKAEFVNCSFSNCSSWAIQFNGGGTTSEILVDGCTFDGANSGIVKVLSAPAENSTFTFTNNTITNSRGHDGKDAEWFWINSAFAITESGNTRDGAEWHPVAAEGLGR